MKALVIGATGFVGSALCETLHERGHDVVAWVRDIEKDRKRLPKWVELLNPKGQKEAIASLEVVDAIANLAGAPIMGKRWTKSYKEELRTSRIERTERLARAINATKSKPAVLLSASAVGYYGDRGSEWLTESSKPGKGFLPKLCLDWESAASMVEDDVRVVLTRLGVVIGPRGGALSKMLPIFRKGLGGPIGTGEQYMSWIHLDDVVAVMADAMSDESYTGPVNLVSPEPVTNKVFTKTLASALGKPAFLKVPRFALRIALGKGEQVLTDSARARPGVLEEHNYQFRYRKLEDALVASLPENSESD